MTYHCQSDSCKEPDKWGYCSCKCQPCIDRKDIEGERAENEWKARREEQIE